MAAKRPNIYTDLHLNARSKAEIRRSRERLRELYASIDLSTIEDLLRKQQREGEADRAEELLGGEIQNMVAELAETLGESSPEIRSEIRKAVREPWVAAELMADDFLRQEAEAVSWLLLRHWINLFSTIQLLPARPKRMPLNRHLLPVRPEEVSEEDWARWQEEARDSLAHQLADYAFDHRQSEKAFEHFSTRLQEQLAESKTGVIELPDRLKLLKRPAGFFVTSESRIHQ